MSTEENALCNNTSNNDQSAFNKDNFLFNWPSNDNIMHFSEIFSSRKIYTIACFKKLHGRLYQWITHLKWARILVSRGKWMEILKSFHCTKWFRKGYDMAPNKVYSIRQDWGPPVATKAKLGTGKCSTDTCLCWWLLPCSR